MVIQQVEQVVDPGAAAGAVPGEEPVGPGRVGAHGRPRDDQREQAILEAAIELLAEVGYDRLSIDVLAARAHASKATIYRRWSGKAEIVAEALRRHKCELDEVAPDTGSLRGDLLAFLCSSIADADADTALVVGVLRAMRGDAELDRLMHLHVIDRKHAQVVAVVERAVQRGELASGDGAATMNEVLQAVVMSRLLLEGAPWDTSFAEHLVDDIALPLLRG